MLCPNHSEGVRQVKPRARRGARIEAHATCARDGTLDGGRPPARRPGPPTLPYRVMTMLAEPRGAENWDCTAQGHDRSRGDCTGSRRFVRRGLSPSGDSGSCPKPPGLSPFPATGTTKTWYDANSWSRHPCNRANSRRNNSDRNPHRYPPDHGPDDEEGSEDGNLVSYPDRCCSGSSPNN